MLYVLTFKSLTNFKLISVSGITYVSSFILLRVDTQFC